MEAHVNQTPNTRLLRIDIGQWGSPVTKQFYIRRLPVVWRYEGRERVTDRLREALHDVDLPR